MKFTIAQDSRCGQRPQNEDRLAYCYTSASMLMVVADGMGGHLYGELAAQIAVDTLLYDFKREAQPTLADPALFLRRTLQHANASIAYFAKKQGFYDIPKTTCVATLIQDQCLYSTHAGDSRLYLIRKGAILMKTQDHSIMALLEAQGLIDEHMRKTHPLRNQVYFCLGKPPPLDFEYADCTPLAPNDFILLCSDGFWSAFPENEILSYLDGSALDRELTRAFDDAEIINGNTADNLSAILLHWDHEDREPSSPPPTLYRSLASGGVPEDLALLSQDIENEIQFAIEKTYNTLDPLDDSWIETLHP